jgi:hypothetical protein
VNSRSALKLSSLLIAASLLTPTTVVFGSGPMLAIRRGFGRSLFWLPFLAVAGGFFAAGQVVAGVTLVVVTVLVGVFAEVEEHGSSLFSSAAMGVLASVGAAAIGVGGYLLHTKTGLQALVQMLAKRAVERLETMNEGAMLATHDLVQQTPSFVLVMLFVAVWFALIWEKRWRRLVRLADDQEESWDKLLAFRVPDVGVWILIAAIAGSFIKHERAMVEIVSLNVLNVMAYFFQGLAVVGSAFRQMKLGPGWRMAWYVLLVLYLNFIVSLVGLVDFWLDFRVRMTAKPLRTDNRI